MWAIMDARQAAALEQQLAGLQALLLPLVQGFDEVR
jgi:hypothetical protein